MIAFLLSFTALAQSNNDSTYCFTLNEVQHFLRTKVELTNALETNYLIVGKLGDAEEIILTQEIELEKKAKKLKRTRAIAGVGSGLALFFGLVVILK